MGIKYMKRGAFRPIPFFSSSLSYQSSRKRYQYLKLLLLLKHRIFSHLDQHSRYHIFSRIERHSRYHRHLSRMALTRAKRRQRPAEIILEEPPPAKRVKKPITLDELVANPAPKKPATVSTSKDANNYARRVRVKKAVTKKLTTSWKHLPASAQQGMHNPGVLCYRNSLLQSLLHSPKFVNWAREHEPKECVHKGKKPCVACPLKELIEAYWSGGGAAALHHTLFLYQKAMAANGGASGQLAGQADPEELLSKLTKVLEEQLPSSHFATFEAFSRTLITTTMKCRKCGHLSATKEIEGTISLSIKPRIKGGKLDDYFNSHLNFPVDGYRCDKCNDNSTKHRSRRISRSADMMVIQLKRFDWGGSKDSFQVPIPQVLDLDQYRTPTNKVPSKYNLSSVVSHAGSRNFGHYICTAKDGNGTWHTFNDKSMSQTTAAAATHGGLKGFTPYMLFYQRT